MPLSAFSLRARYVFPVSSEPIEHGVVTIEGGRIAAVGTAAPAGCPLDDLGDVALLPGLINAHTHLDLSNFDHPLGEPGIRLVDWIPRLLEHRAKRSESGPDAVVRGLRECLRSGTTALADFAAPNWPRDELDRCPLRVALFQELIAPTFERISPAFEMAERHFRTPPACCWQLGLGPHAPYTVRPELFDAVIDLSARSAAPVAMHLAESAEEIELLATGGGPFREMLETLGAWSPGLVPAPLRPIDYLHKLSAAPRAAVIHGNYLSGAEWAFLAKRRERMGVVYCPRSHAHFGHAAYPLGRMLAAGVNVCLGTDGRASAPDLSLVAELRFAAARHPDVAPATLLELATLAAARALGGAAEFGSLEPDKHADLTAVAVPPTPTADPHDALLHGDGPVGSTWIGGHRCLPSGEQASCPRR